MPNISIHKARELPQDVKLVLETLLARAIEPDEEVSVRAYPPHRAPVDEIRQALVRRLEDRINRTAEQVKGVPDDELEAILDEAMDHVRPRRP